MTRTSIAAGGLTEAPRGPDQVSSFTPWLALACLIGVLFISAGCSLVSREVGATKSLAQSITGTGGKSAATNAAATMQSAVMREADQYVGTVAQATDDFRKQVRTTETRELAQQWKLNEATVAYVNATDENPLFGAVGMVVLASLSSIVIEDYWVGERFGASAGPMLKAHRQLESNAWSLVRGVLTPTQERELRSLLRQYHKKYPHMRYVAAVRLPELVAMLAEVSPQERQNQKSGSLFDLLYVNPLAGLDPTTEAIQQTRLLAQRAMYYAQRAPMLLGWQVELTTYQLATQPEAQEVLSDVGDVAKSTTVFAKTAEGLPKLVNDQREAAINQLLAGVTTAGSNLLVRLSNEERKMEDLLSETRQTLNAGSDMANSLNAAIRSLDAFVHYVSPPPGTNTAPQPAETDSPSFNVLDYGKVAGQIGAMAKDLNTLLTSANHSTPEVARLSQQAGADAKKVVNHAFRLGLVLILVLGIVSVLVVRTCRRLGRLAGVSGRAQAASTL